MKNWPLFCWSRGGGVFWFRIKGYGWHVINRAIHRPLFSERMGYTKVKRFGQHSMKFLTPGVREG